MICKRTWNMYAIKINLNKSGVFRLVIDVCCLLLTCWYVDWLC